MMRDSYGYSTEYNVYDPAEDYSWQWDDDVYEERRDREYVESLKKSNSVKGNSC